MTTNPKEWKPSRHIQPTHEGPYLVDCARRDCDDPTHTGGTLFDSAHHQEPKTTPNPEPSPSLPSDRICVKCGRPAESPFLPLCIDDDLVRLARGETTEDIRREAREKGVKL